MKEEAVKAKTEVRGRRVQLEGGWSTRRDNVYMFGDPYDKKWPVIELNVETKKEEINESSSETT